MAHLVSLLYLIFHSYVNVLPEGTLSQEKFYQMLHPTNMGDLPVGGARQETLPTYTFYGFFRISKTYIGWNLRVYQHHQLQYSNPLTIGRNCACSFWVSRVGLVRNQWQGMAIYFDLVAYPRIWDLGPPWPPLSMVGWNQHEHCSKSLSVIPYWLVQNGILLWIPLDLLDYKLIPNILGSIIH